MIDEQHRFGVHQRLALQTKGGKGGANVLVMTATPIPRTLADDALRRSRRLAARPRSRQAASRSSPRRVAVEAIGAR